MRWSYGVTTVEERLQTFLPTTLASLHSVGFTTPRLFIDGPAFEGHKQLGLSVSSREDAIGVGPHWFLSLHELYYRDPKCDRYALFQDDIVCCRNLKEYVERWYPAEGYLNLCTFPENADRLKGKPYGWHRAPRNGKGAQALVFDQTALKMLFASDYMFDKIKNRRTGHLSVDGTIQVSLVKQGIKEYVHVPSLVDHLGAEGKSAIGIKSQPKILSFPGEDHDPLVHSVGV